MTLAALRASALDRSLVGDDPEAALALAGVVDEAMRRTDGDPSASPFAAAMLAIGCVGAVNAPPTTPTLDDRAWRPGHDADPFVVTGAAVAVRKRGITVERAADLAGCSPARIGAAIDQLHRDKE